MTISLKNLAQASAQEVFSQVAVHLLRQKAKSKSESDGFGYCRYRGAHNRMCAAGCLIADNEYSEAFEYKGWRELIERGLVTANHADLIADLQRLHDQYEPSEWAKQLNVIALSYDLKRPLV